MVRKIGGKPPTGTTQSAPVQATKTVSSAKVGAVGQVQGTEAKQRVAGAGGSPGKITAEQREQLFQMIEEEAEKLFADNVIPPNKKESIKGAVRMVIDGSIAEDDEKS